MSSKRSFPLYWGRYKLNPTIKFTIKSKTHKNHQDPDISLCAITNSEPVNTSRRNRNHVVIDFAINDINNKLPYTIKVPSLLQKHFNCMYNTGIFPYNYAGKGFLRIKCVLQQTLFWMIATLSIIDALRLVKYFSVGYIQKGDLYGYTIMSFMVLKACIRFYFLYALVFKCLAIANVQKTIEAFTNSMQNMVQQDSNVLEHLILGCMWTFTFMGSFVGTIFGYASVSSGWSIETAVTIKSFQMSEAMFLWTSNSTEILDIRMELLEKYGLVMSYTSGFLALASAVLEFFGSIYDNAVDDLLLVVATTVYILVNDFQFGKVTPIELGRDSELVWKHYRQLQTVSEVMENAFGKLFKITHFSNLIRCGYYLLILTRDNGYDVYFFLFTLTIIKLIITSFLGVNASGKNNQFRRWIQQTYLEQPCIVVGNRHLQTSLVLDELTTNPIGLGSDNFHVDEGFILKRNAVLQLASPSADGFSNLFFGISQAIDEGGERSKVKVYGYARSKNMSHPGALYVVHH
ncbi:unnamed protein product [Orchesella dallaii]|uniref:Gustatory receptor n=1 Tax=Orchesella dallaii TaxID=48710 RepID=A0ABP1S4Z4_9HEXA